MAKRKRPDERFGRTSGRAEALARGVAAEDLERDIAAREAARHSEDTFDVMEPIDTPSIATQEVQEPKRMPIGEAEVLHAAKVLEEYKAQKKMFDMHITADEDWWRLRHWEQLNAKDGETNDETERGEIDPKSAWLFNSVISKHADFMDAVPTFAALPREAGDERAAKLLTAILPVIFERNDFEETYDNASLAKCKHGTGCYSATWDGTMYHGLGDIRIDEIDVLRLFWQGGVQDIQDSENLFYVVKMSRDAVKAAYPATSERLSGAHITGSVEEYRSDDYVDDSGMVEVVDWYYRKDGILHLCKFAAGTVLGATENDPESYPHGIYAHGQYPFFLDPYFKIKNSPAGFGLIDVGKSDQEQIDRTSRAMMNNVLGSSRQRTFISEAAGVNEEDLADPKKSIVRCAGMIDENNFRVIQPNANAEMYMSVITQKVQQMKDTSGNSEVMTGNAPSGVTAASAIAALQEQAGRTSRDAIKASYRVFARLTKCVIELIREFYDMPRAFRIVGEGGAASYVTFSRDDLTPHRIERLDGTAINAEPVFDISVSAQKSSPYAAMAQNELALQLYNAGFFDPARADQAIATLEMMDFKDKDKLIGKISQNGTLYQMVKVLSERLAKAEAMIGVGAPMQSRGASVPSGRTAEMPEQNAEGVVSEESGVTKKARERSAATTIPR
jgi:hypothetical protein